MSPEDELLAIARARENVSEATLASMWLEQPGTLRRQLRSDLARQVDLDRLRRTDDQVIQLNMVKDGLQELVCPGVEFRSDSRLDFRLELEQHQEGWLVTRFQFHLHLLNRNLGMIRIHLNDKVGHDPLSVPRCHLHIGDSKAHIPFPVMSPRLMVHLICEHIEPDVGL